MELLTTINEDDTSLTMASATNIQAANVILHILTSEL